MDAKSYDEWYQTPRGQWIGECEVSLVLDALQPQPGESLLDVGCGTGYFTRALSSRVDGRVVGVDTDAQWLQYARDHERTAASYQLADARALPFADRSFDLVVSIAALCFVDDEIAAAREIARVTRRRFAIGLLNRRSLLWLRKGRGGGTGAYRGARWHTVREARALLRGLPVQQVRTRTAIQIPTGGPLARRVERWWPAALGTGAFILVSGDVAPS